MILRPLGGRTETLNYSILRAGFSVRFDVTHLRKQISHFGLLGGGPLGFGSQGLDPDLSLISMPVGDLAAKFRLHIVRIELAQEQAKLLESKLDQFPALCLRAAPTKFGDRGEHSSIERTVVEHLLRQLGSQSGIRQ